jgi:hypothetical protein
VHGIFALLPSVAVFKNVFTPVDSWLPPFFYFIIQLSQAYSGLSPPAGQGVKPAYFFSADFCQSASAG